MEALGLGGARASAVTELGDHRGGARASAASEFGDHRGGARASTASELGEQRGDGRACFAFELGDLRGDRRAGRSIERGEHLGHDRASTSAERYLGEAALRDRASLQGGHSHQRALRQDREVVEDGDLKSITIQLPQLPSPEGRDASLEAGDWLIQLEPLIGDLSKMQPRGGGGSWRQRHRSMHNGFMQIPSRGFESRRLRMQFCRRAMRDWTKG